MTGKEIRNSFLSFFKEKNHEIVPSSSLVPHGDPTLLFTNAGMVQFKSVFLGDEEREYSRAVTVQKCLRAGGKHNDLENVGRTARHHTFFEMLGNFSLGDYFKEEAISLAWEFLTTKLELPRERLWVTIFDDDDEAFDLWKKVTDVSPDRIIRCGEKDNFWSMGDTGPCGPCSEIHYDQGEEVGCGKTSCNVECDCDRYLEVWNLVFMQYNRDENGVLTPLPSPSIDTGMGLERLVAVVQGRHSNYDSDLFGGIFTHLEEMSGKKYGENDDDDVSMRVIADHIRATTFLISDGVLPSNEGRGYVLRRIMRRALRHGKMLGFSGPFLHLAAEAVAGELGEVYPELVENKDYCTKIIFHEEERFLETLDHGLKLLGDEIAIVKKSKKTQLSGDVAFKLYDTYGFPLDLTEDILKNENMTVELAGFDAAMEKQKETAREAWAGSGEGAVKHVYTEIARELKNRLKDEEVEFLGYDGLEVDAEVLFLVKDEELLESAPEGEDIEVVTDKTTFYGESGGQKGDAGTFSGANGFKMIVTDTIKPVPGLFVHRGKVEKGIIKKGDSLTLSVDIDRRTDTERNHTATHLLHSALKSVLGDHVKQAGSLVSSERLRFDFSHFAAMTLDEISRTEEIVNKEIWKNSSVGMENLTLEEAKSRGATALFGEKYGDNVRVVTVPDFSMELCGGTHVGMVGEIGPFKIISEGGIAAGVRRIEAATGKSAYNYLVRQGEEISALAGLVKGKPGEIQKKVETLIKRQKELESEVGKLKEKLASGGEGDLMEKLDEAGGVKVLASIVDGADAGSLRGVMDNLKAKVKSGVIVLGSSGEGKVMLIAGVTADLTDRLHAGKIIAEIAPIVGGKGGGRPDMAQAGGKDAAKLNDAIGAVKGIVEKIAGK